MALTTSTLAASLTWAMEKTNTGFEKTKHSDSIEFSLAPAVGTWNHVFVARYSISASGTQAIDLFAAFTNLVCESVSPTKVVAVILTVTGTNAACKIEPGASNPLTWFFSGTSPAVTVPTGGCLFFAQPTSFVVSSTVRNLLLTNTGSGTATVDIGFVLGT